jgi:hypothetical protein
MEEGKGEERETTEEVEKMEKEEGKVKMEEEEKGKKGSVEVVGVLEEFNGENSFFGCLVCVNL